ncbi:hypothetical protein C2R22_08595 [Salinigranum rubrum]|uniref:Uncharacterized protein n=1 Tax=Salinigranum rubrum TaxID=755307 RepID=A0A2I8VPR7_9EURY|nr:hypothetical protein C2R22_08595 [Salinigranum rubrum]
MRRSRLRPGPVSSTATPRRLRRRSLFRFRLLPRRLRMLPRPCSRRRRRHCRRRWLRQPRRCQPRSPRRRTVPPRRPPASRR